MKSPSIIEIENVDSPDKDKRMTLASFQMNGYETQVLQQFYLEYDLNMLAVKDEQGHKIER